MATMSPAAELPGPAARLCPRPRTEKREVFYLWHPWAGCTVENHEVAEKASGNVAPCSRDAPRRVARWNCRHGVWTWTGLHVRRCAWRPALGSTSPLRTDDAAGGDAVTDVAPSNAPVLGVQTASRDENREVIMQCQSNGHPTIEPGRHGSICLPHRRGADAGVRRTFPEERRSALTGLMVQLILARGRSRSAAAGGGP